MRNKRRRFNNHVDGRDVFGEFDRSSTPRIQFFLPSETGDTDAFGLKGEVHILSDFVKNNFIPPYKVPFKYVGYEEVKRGELLLKLRKFYVDLNSEKMFGSNSPKESFNRWLMERKLHEGLNDEFMDPVLPSKKGLEISPLMYREISDDVPVKVGLFPKSMEELKNSIRLFCEKSLYLCGENEKIGEKLSEEEVEEIRENVKNIENEATKFVSITTSSGSEELVSELLEKFKGVRSVIVPLFQKKLKTTMEEICQEVEAKSIEFSAELRDLKIKIASKDPTLRVSNKVDFSELGGRRGYQVSSCGKSFFLNKHHFTKLRGLYAGNEENFINDLFRLLCRYEFFFGDPEKERSYEGSGHQGAIPPSSFKYLKEKFGVEMECFASPLNCYFTNFCSAFIDTDFLFGSVGSFFDFYPLEGSFEANPPFVEELMIKMVIRIEELIREANKRNSALSFFVIVPGWDDAESIQRLMKSEFSMWQGELMPQEHCYVTGFQHKERVNFFKQYYEAVHTSRVFFLQSVEGNKKWTPTKEKVDGLVSHFHKKEYVRKFTNNTKNTSFGSRGDRYDYGRRGSRRNY